MPLSTLELYRAFHKALHSNRNKLTIGSTSYPVESSRGRRYIRYENQVFAQQDPGQKTNLARKARTEPITRIVRTGQKWGWISNTEIVDPLLK